MEIIADHGKAVPITILTGFLGAGKGIVPQPKLPREEQQEQLTRDLEIDPKKYYPPDVYREPTTKLANPEVIDLIALAKVMGIDLTKFVPKK
jgi:hypothetical protein